MNKKIIAIAIAIAVVSFAAFQNCARVKMKEPPANMIAGISAQVFNACVNGLTQPCSDATGNGIRCIQPRPGVPNVCIYESCNPGYINQVLNCVPVSCTPNQVANCVVPYGQGQMTCASNGSGYGGCSATECLTGYSVVNGMCVPSENAGGGSDPTPTPDPESPTPSPTPFCEPESHRSCDTESTYRSQTCAADGSSYGECVTTACKPGYNEQGGACVLNECEPNVSRTCEFGNGIGSQTCSSFGNSWGSCVLSECASGYNLIGGVCVERACTPGESVTCEFDHGIGAKTCNDNGSGYGECVFVACTKGHTHNNGVCTEDKCTPGAASSCQVTGGTGEMMCYENGQGHGPCNIKDCDDGYELRNGVCVGENDCDDGDTFTCTRNHGFGSMGCVDKKKGQCVLTSCESGYTLTLEGKTTVCKPPNNGKNN
jgi:hypothetical protein